MQIAYSLPELQDEAYRLTLDTIREESLDTTTYRLVVDKLASKSEEESSQRESWIKDATKRATALADKLEQEVKAYKNNLIKESIRMGQQDIASHSIKTGDLSNALRTLIRNRDYCTTPLHVFQVNMSIIDVSILLGQWPQVQTYLSKLEGTTLPELQENRGKLDAATGLVLLSRKNYAEAARTFLKIDSSIGTTYNNIISMHDIANFTCLLALATFSRDEILMLSESTSFKPFLELEIMSREALTAFHKQRYAECFKLLDSLQADMIADVYFSSHVTEIYELIRERSYLQYISAFSTVPLSRISIVFAQSSSEIESCLCKLISAGKLKQTRIDAKNGLIVHEETLLRESAYLKSLQTGKSYCDMVEVAVTYLALSHSDLQVTAQDNSTGKEEVEPATDFVVEMKVD